jgi:AcrR family transcriptional regulator
MARAGRRPAGSDTRGEILAAARSAFAAQGFHGATLRAIAAEAGVDPALVLHYFGSKEDLFGACVNMPVRPREAAEGILQGGVENAGRNLARLFLSVWETPASRDGLLAMLRSSLTTEQGAAALREFFQSALIDRMTPQLEAPNARLRVSLVAAHLVGIAVLRYVIRFEELARADVDELVEVIAPRLQSYFTG